MTQEIENRVSHVETQLAALTGHVERQGAKLEEIFKAVTKQEARPAFNIPSVLSVVKDLGIVIGLAAGATIYMATNISDKPVSLLTQRIDRLESQQDKLVDRVVWKPTFERTQ